MKKLIVIILLSTILSYSFCQNFTVNGITYNITSDSTCAVYGSSLTHVIIPPYVTYNETTREVTSFCYYSSGYLRHTFSNGTIQTLSIPHTIKSLSFHESYYLCYNCPSLTTIIYNAKEITDNPDTNIFRWCPNITNVTIGDSVREIPPYLFSNCTNIRNVTFPDSLKAIKEYAFAGCTGLSNIEWSSNLESIENHAFYNCTGLSEIVLPESTKKIGGSAFYGCSNLYNIHLGPEIDSIGTQPFGNCTFIHNVTYLPRNAYYTPSTIGMFEGCSNIDSIYIGDSVLTLPHYFARNKSNLQHIHLPEELVSIGNFAFNGCGLEEIVIPSTVTTIGQNAFTNNVNMSRIVSLPNNPPSIYQSTFSSTPVIVPCEREYAYAIAPWWNIMTDIKETCRYSSTIDTICHGETILFGTQIISDSGTYIDTIHIDQYIDSIATLIVCTMPSFDTTINAQICDNQTYIGFGFDTNQPGYYTRPLQTVFGCDSIIRLNLTVHPTFDTTIDAEICDGETFSGNEFSEQQTGTYDQHLQSTHSCDSTIHLNLAVHPTYNETIAATITDDNSYTFISQTLTQPGIFVDTIATQYGCDSILTLNLSVIPSIDTLVIHDTIIQIDTINTIDSIFIHDTTIIRDTIIQHIVDTLFIFDTTIINDTITIHSIDTLFIFDTIILTDTLYIVDTIIPCPIIHTYIHAFISEGETFTEYGFNESSAGTYIDTLTSEDGCDSIVHLFLSDNLYIDPTAIDNVAKIYPNPTSSYVNIAIPAQSKPNPIAIIDNRGRIVKIIPYHSDAAPLRVDLSDLSSGIYYIKIDKTIQKLIVK